MSDSSIINTLAEIRSKLQTQENSQESSFLELTEDDLLDEEDEDAFIEERDNIKKNTDINDFLTELDHSLDSKNNLDEVLKSVDYIKKILSDAKSGSLIQARQDEITLLQKEIKVVVDDWCKNNLPNIIKNIIEQQLDVIIKNRLK